MKAYIDEFTAIAAQMTGAPVLYYERVQLMNIKADNVTAPIVYIPSIILGDMDKVGIAWKRKQKVKIAFMKQVQFEAELTDELPVVDDMLDMCVEFLTLLNRSKVLDHPTTVATEYAIEFDANLAGWMITFDCSLRYPLTSCI
jgi:hypothetical protein